MNSRHELNPRIQDTKKRSDERNSLNMQMIANELMRMARIFLPGKNFIL